MRLGAAVLIVAAFNAAVVSAVGSAVVRNAPVYNLAPTQWCLRGLPNAVAGLPPATSPKPPALFVYALARDDIPIGFTQPRPPSYKQLGVWYGDRTYEGIILTFFKNVPAARASLKSFTSLYGGKLVRNVVVSWDQKAVPRASVREAVLGCLRTQQVGKPAGRATPPATLATFAGKWGGHTRGLSITSKGRGQEGADSGCCTRGYRLSFQILSVKGTLTRATAVYRATSFRLYLSGTKRIHVGEVGQLLLKNGVVTNTLTNDYFCSDPAWGATGICGA